MLNFDGNLIEAIQFWGMVISAIIMIATVLQVVVSYLIAKSLRTLGDKSTLLNASSHANKQWQEFNKLVIIDPEFRKTLMVLENLEASDSVVQTKYMIFFILNILHDQYAARESLGITNDHIEANIKEMIGTLKAQKDLVLSILNGNRGYDKPFIEECKKHL
ncbi:MAG: hypothetical protein OFPII_43340 [Osedax symbiont Rs1]|nr:MAG: hypothetical protein OFPII_43340 [Osedax symbiont Rs1]